MLLGYFGFPRSMVSSYRILDILETHLGIRGCKGKPGHFEGFGKKYIRLTYLNLSDTLSTH